MNKWCLLAADRPVVVPAPPGIEVAVVVGTTRTVPGRVLGGLTRFLPCSLGMHFSKLRGLGRGHRSTSGPKGKWRMQRPFFLKRC